jgi:hypothetical protein
MGQPINYSDDPKKDLENLDAMLGTLLTFGFLHEDQVSSIDQTMKLYVTTNDKNIRQEVKDEWEQVKDDYDDISEWISDTYSWDEIWVSDLAKAAIKVYRDIINSVMYSDSYKEAEEILEEVLDQADDIE